MKPSTLQPHEVVKKLTNPPFYKKLEFWVWALAIALLVGGMFL